MTNLIGIRRPRTEGDPYLYARHTKIWIEKT